MCSNIEICLQHETPRSSDVQNTLKTTVEAMRDWHKMGAEEGCWVRRALGGRINPMVTCRQRRRPSGGSLWAQGPANENPWDSEGGDCGCHFCPSLSVNSEQLNVL